jgi:hypothetical protein
MACFQQVYEASISIKDVEHVGKKQRIINPEMLHQHNGAAVSETLTWKQEDGFQK